MLLRGTPRRSLETAQAAKHWLVLHRRCPLYELRQESQARTVLLLEILPLTLRFIFVPMYEIIGFRCDVLFIYIILLCSYLPLTLYYSILPLIKQAFLFAFMSYVNIYMRLYADSAYEKTHDILAPPIILCFSPSLDLFLTRIIFSYGKCFGFFVFFPYP